MLLNDIADFNSKLSLLPSGGGGSRGEQKHGEDEDSRARDILALTGTDTAAGKLQVGLQYERKLGFTCVVKRMFACVC